MRKPVFALALILVLVFTTGAQAPRQKPEDMEKNLVLVEESQAVPDSLKAGFDTITPEGSMAMLTFLASDLLEGRDTATEGYKLAAEYVASMFQLWGIKPAGDMPSRMKLRNPYSSWPQIKAVFPLVACSWPMAAGTPDSDPVKTSLPKKHWIT